MVFASGIFHPLTRNKNAAVVRDLHELAAEGAPLTDALHHASPLLRRATSINIENKKHLNMNNLNLWLLYAEVSEWQTYADF